MGRFWKYIRRKYPDIVVENCSSGSLRQELFTFAHTDMEWLSDVVDNDQNLAINYGATYFLPPEACDHWTCYPQPTEAMDTTAAFVVSMMGWMGISGPILDWTEAEKAEAKRCIALYKRLRPLLRKSLVFHLTPQVQYDKPHSVEAALYVDKEDGKALLFAFQGAAPGLQCTLHLRGLEAKARYRLELLLHEEGVTLFTKEATGAELASGLDLSFPHKGATALVELVRVE